VAGTNKRLNGNQSRVPAPVIRYGDDDALVSLRHSWLLVGVRQFMPFWAYSLRLTREIRNERLRPNITAEIVLARLIAKICALTIAESTWRNRYDIFMMLYEIDETS